MNKTFDDLIIAGVVIESDVSNFPQSTIDTKMMYVPRDDIAIGVRLNEHSPWIPVVYFPVKRSEHGKEVMWFCDHQGEPVTFHNKNTIIDLKVYQEIEKL